MKIFEISEASWWIFNYVAIYMFLNLKG